MSYKIFAVILLSANLASAAPVADELDTAIAEEHAASTREQINAQLTIIAERDIVTAQIIRDMARTQWDAAVREHRPDAAGTWAKRHSLAMRDEREAQERASFYAIERDQARREFEASAAKVRRLDIRASR
jgi:hypothetical protein